jgi:hypothetical protein
MTLSDARMTKAKNKETRDASLVPKFVQAVNHGMAGLHIDDLLRDAPDTTSSSGAEPEGIFFKDQRRLPHIINTAHYIQDPWVGLFEDLDNTIPEVSYTLDQTVDQSYSQHRNVEPGVDDSMMSDTSS